MINCALSRTTIEKLYKSIYKHMSDSVKDGGKPFSPEDYMAYVYGNKAQVSTPENAAKLVQHVPRMIIDLYNTDFMQNPDFTKLDLNALDDIARSYIDPNDGITNIINKYKETSKKFLRALVNTLRNEQGNTEEVDTEETFYMPSERFMPYSALTGTLQELVAVDPTRTDLFIESLEDSKRTIYNTLTRIQTETGGIDSIIDTLEYQGKKLKLKALPLTEIDQDQLDSFTRELIVRSRSIKKTAKTAEGVTPADEQVLLVLSDEGGNFIYFSEDGSISTKADGGRLVYQFLRDVRKEGNKYSVSNIYGYKSVLSPAEIAMSLYKVSDPGVIANIEQEQQEEFKLLYDLRERVLNNNEQPNLPIAGISTGVLEGLVGRTIFLSDLAAKANVDKEVFKSIKTVQKDRGSFKKGFATITINGAEVIIDRADTNADIARQVAKVLTNKELPYKVRSDFYFQFFNNKIDYRARRHVTSGNLDNQELYFNYSNSTFQEKPTRKFLENTIDLSQSNIESLTDEQLAKHEEQIYQVLMEGKGKKGKYFPTKLTYNSELLKNERYFTYDINTKEIKFGNYIDFIKTLKAPINLSNVNKDVVNNYIIFGAPSKLNNFIQKAKETQEKDTRSETKKLKDEIVDLIKQDGPVEATVKSPKSGFYMGKHYANFQVQIDGIDTPAKVYYPNKTLVITKDGKTFKDTNFPVESDTVMLQLRDELSVNGQIFNDVIEVYQVKPDGSVGEYLGVIAERDISEYNKPSVPEETEELEIEVPTEEDKTPVSPIIEDIEQNEGPVTPHNDNTNVSNLLKKNWKGLDRARILPNDATMAQVEEANKWWNSEFNPLKGKISLDPVANLVNSDSWARFIAAGQTLLSGESLGEIQINKGTMVDVYHEAWHAFSQLYLTRQQKIILYDEVRNYTDANGNKPHLNKSYLDIEEMLAEDFRSYAKNPKQQMKDAPVKKSIFRKILDFLKALFGMSKKGTGVLVKTEVTNQDYPGVVNELYNKLYFAGSSKEASEQFMNTYKPTLDNVMWDMLNRGIERVDARGEDALSRQDSILISESIDSIISELVDNLNKGFNKKSSTIKLLTDPENRAIAYESVKEILEDKLKLFKEDLGTITNTPFNSLSTIEELDSNAVAVIKSEKGDHKYIFLSNQIDSFSNLNPDTEGGTRIKGQSYYGIDIIADFYSHKDIISGDGEGADIIIVKDLRDAEVQFDNYIKGGAKDFTELQIKNSPEYTPLTHEQAELLDKIRILELTLNNWGDDTKGVVKYHKDNSRFDIIREDYSEESYEETDEDGDPVDPTSAEGSEMQLVKDGSVGKKSLEQLAQKEALYVIRSLFKIQKGETVDNKLGFKQLADFSKIWKIVTREIGGVKDVNTMYEKLEKAAQEYAPELKQLVYNKMPNPANVTRAAEFDIIASIWQTFSRPRVPYMQLTAYLNEKYDEIDRKKYIESVTVEVTDASIDSSNIIRKFQSEFKAQSEKDNKYISKVDNVTTLNDLSKLVKDFADKRNPLELDVNKSFEFARAIGFMFDDFKIIKDQLKKRNDFYGLQYIYTIVKDLANIQEKGTKAPAASIKVLADFVVDPLRTLQAKIPGTILPSLRVKEVYQKNIVKRLAELQSRYGLEGSNFSVLNPEKNLVNEFIDDHSASRIVDAINRAEYIQDLYSNPTAPENPLKFMSYLNPEINTFVNNNRSQILNSIFATEGDGKKIQGRSLKLFVDAGTQVANTDIGTTTTSLDIYSKFLQEMHLMLKGGVQEFLRHASKKSSFGVKVDGGIVKHPGKGDDNNLYVDMAMFAPNKGGEAYAINNILIPYLASEHERIMKFNANKEECLKYAGYNRVVDKDANGNKIYAGEVFTLFDNVLTEDTKKDLLSEEVINTIKEQGIYLEDFLKADKSGLKQRVIDDITNYFNQQTSQNLSFLTAQDYIDESLYEKLGPNNLDKQMQKELIIKAYTYNSWIHNFETANLIYTDPTQRDHSKENEHKRNTGSTSGGPKFMTDIVAQNFINNIWNKDRVDNEGKVIERVTYASKLAAQTNNEEYNKFHYDGTMNTAVIEDIERPSEYLKNIEKALRDDYKRNGKTDSQINDLLAKELKPYKEMNEADGAGYIAIDAYRTLKKLENAWSNKQEELYKKVINNKPISASDVVNYFPVYKLQNYGALANTILPVGAFHKFALMPLIPSEIKGSQLDHFHKEMMRNNVQYVTYKSGSKVGSISSNGKADAVFADAEKTVLKKEITLTHNTIYLEYLKNVTNVNAKFKGETTFPTQLRGLILDGMYSQGIVTKAEYEKLGERYDKIVADYTELLKLEVLNEIGYEEKNGKYVGNIKNFLELIQRELGKRDMPDHLLSSIGVDRKGNIKTDLSLHLEADTIERMLLSVLTKRLIRQKIKGEPLIQVPSSMYNGLWDGLTKFDKTSDADRKKYLGSNNLPFYYPGKDGTNAMKIAIALQGDFVNLLKLQYKGEEIGTLERLNEAIKDDEWLNTDNNRKAISLTGARIPIQNLNSMEFAEVWHFLDPSAGNKVVVPTEIVAKAGSDFDVDKIFWMMPHISSRGEYVTGAIDNADLKKKIADLDKIKPKPGMKKPSAKALIQKQKKALQNELIQATRDILSTPGNYASLVRPNETHLVKGTADEFEPYVIEYNRYNNMHGEDQRMGAPNDEGKRKKSISPTRVLEVGYNLHKHDVNMVGKDTLGIEALQNKKHPIFKAIAAKMPKTYKESFYDQNSGKYVDGERDFDMRLLMPHAKIDGHISLSNDTNVAGTRIADVYSHIMNGLLDVEADPWAFFIQANLETISILNYLLEAGVPEKTAIAFVSQPMIREYATNQKMLKSTFSVLANKEITPFQYVKSSAARKVESKIPYSKKMAYLAKINSDNFDRVASKVSDNDQVKVVLKTGPQIVSFKQLKYHLSKGTINLANIVSLYSYKDNKMVYKRATSLITNDNYYDAAILASQEPGVLNSKGHFDEEALVNSIKNPKDPKNKAVQIAAFLHFLEIEKQIKGLEAVKRQSNPDTKLLKTIQQVRKREQAFLDSTETSKVDPALPEAIRNKSILRSFYQGDLALDLVEPVMPLRLNKEVSNFITNKLNTDKTTISSKFGQGMDGDERFTSEFNNGVINYIFQNYMSNFVDSNGKIVELPDIYRGKKVVIKPGVTNGVEFADDKIFIDRAQLIKDYTQKKYLRSSQDADSYANRGLATFSTEDNPFPSQASFNRYVVEREFLRTLYNSGGAENIAYEKFLAQRSLINTFNRDMITGTSEYSYTDLLMKTLKEFSQLKDIYPVMAQLSVLPYKGKEKIVQLNDRNILDGELGDVYYQNIKELADPNVTKVIPTSNTNEAIEAAKADNKRLSDVFRVFSLMMIHQHGVGYSKYGFSKALDDNMYLEVMRSAAGSFMNNNLNEASLSKVYNKLMGDSQFKNYVVSPNEFNTNKVEASTTDQLMMTKNIINDLVNTMGENEFNDAIGDLNSELSIIDVPENLNKEKLYSENYDDYVPVTYETLSVMLDRFITAGVDTNNVPFMFHDFTTDTSMSIEEFATWVQNNVTMPEVLEPEIEGSFSAIDDLFGSNPQLVNIGTPEEYSSYLNSIGVTQIGYHHSDTDLDSFKTYGEGYFPNALKKKGTHYKEADDVVFFVKKPLTEEFMSQRKFTGAWGLKIPNTLQFNAGEKIGEGVHPGIDEGVKAAIDGNYDAVDFGRIRDNKTWSEVIAITKPNMAIKLGSEQDIKAFKEFVSKDPSYQNVPTTTSTPSKISSSENPIMIYSDGSDIKGTGRVGFGAVYKYQNKEFGLSGTEEGEAVQDLQAKFPSAKFSNPTMEMLALATVLETFQDTGEHIVINQDYSGAVNYAGLWERSEGSDKRGNKPWNSKEPYIKHLINKSLAAIERIEANGGSVRLNWVKGHSGDTMNDLADEYAKERSDYNDLANALKEQSKADTKVLFNTVDDYSVIEEFYAEAQEYKKATGKELIPNLGSVEDLIERYAEIYADTMSQEQFIEYIKNCG